MKHPLDPIRRQCRHVTDAVRWACILEATAPKVGNVHPSRQFVDLCYADFVRAAEITAQAFTDSPSRFSRAVESAATEIADTIGSNVNLGILLLLGPLIQAESASPTAKGDIETWVSAITQTLESLDAEDASRLYNAINVSNPGGMGTRETMDVRQAPPDSFLVAMISAKERDRIALNYAVGFRDLFENVVPVVRDCMEACGDVLVGIADAHVELLSARPDTLIARKFGVEVADEVCQRAGAAKGNPKRLAELDAYLRGGSEKSGRRLNPGTTADLIAAALYVLLRGRDARCEGRGAWGEGRGARARKG
ncbi:MAG: triphosphoribosyl-dephospho-CoA synthase [Planctomycetota bacterium]